MRIARLAAVAAFALVLPTALAAELKDIIKIGVVNMDRLFAEYASKSDAALALQKKKEQYANEVRAELVTIKKMEQELKDQVGSMSDSEKRRRTAEVEFKKEELTSLVARRNAELEKEEKQLTEPILKEIYGAIKTVADKQGVKIVLDSRSYIAYHDLSLDLTELVMNRLRLVLSQKKQY